MREKRKIYRSTLSPKAGYVYQYLYDRADKDGRSFPSLLRIAKDLNVSKNTVIRAVKELENEKYITRENRYRKNGGRSSNLYIVL